MKGMGAARRWGGLCTVDTILYTLEKGERRRRRERDNHTRLTKIGRRGGDRAGPTSVIPKRAECKAKKRISTKRLPRLGCRFESIELMHFLDAYASFPLHFRHRSLIVAMIWYTQGHKGCDNRCFMRTHPTHSPQIRSDD